MNAETGSSPFHTMTDEPMMSSLNTNSFEELLYDTCGPQIKEESLSPTYTCMKPALQSSYMSELDTAVENETLNFWTNIHPEHWLPAQVFDWIWFVANQSGITNVFKVGAENIQEFSGQKLCSLSRQQFMEYMPEFGHIFYEELQKLLQEATFEEPDMILDLCNLEDAIGPIQANESWSMENTGQSNEYCNMSEDGSTSAVLKMNRCHSMDHSSAYNMGGCQYTYDPRDPMFPTNAPLPDDGYGTENSGDPSDRDSIYSGDGYSPSYCLTSFIPTWPTQSLSYSGSCNSERSRKSSKSSDLSDDDSDVPTTPLKRTGRRGRLPGKSNGNHLWEFVRDLLKNPEYNNRIIKWEDRRAGIFRLIDSKDVASLWGRKKSNNAMTYEKLSRAMRFSRTAGYFADVPKDGKFPKKLCFRFGARSFGWQED